MKKVYIINYFDPEDNYKGTICISENEPKNMSQECVDAIKSWFQYDEAEPFDEDEFRQIIADLRQNGYAKNDTYEFTIEESFVY